MFEKYYLYLSLVTLIYHQFIILRYTFSDYIKYKTLLSYYSETSEKKNEYILTSSHH